MPSRSAACEPASPQLASRRCTVTVRGPTALQSMVSVSVAEATTKPRGTEATGEDGLARAVAAFAGLRVDGRVGDGDEGPGRRACGLRLAACGAGLAACGVGLAACGVGLGDETAPGTSSPPAEQARSTNARASATAGARRCIDARVSSGVERELEVEPLASTRDGMSGARLPSQRGSSIELGPGCQWRQARLLRLEGANVFASCIARWRRKSARLAGRARRRQPC